ncbi:MAG: M28 family peptidase [Saprospiraceae bacterium]
MFKFIISAILVFTYGSMKAQNQVPVVHIESIDHDLDMHSVTIHYTLTDAENDICTVSLAGSDSNGETFLMDVNQATGDIGPNIAPGVNKTIHWIYADTTNLSKAFAKVIADDGQVAGIAELVAQVDSNRLKTRLAELAKIRHYSSNPQGLNDARDSIKSRLDQNGLNPESWEFTWSTTTGQNITGRKPGLTNEYPTYIIDAHYDSVSNSPGADDNGSGVVGMMEIMDILSQYQFKKSLRFIGFDLEEAGLKGSTEYVQSQIKPYEQIEGVLNFEMIGYYSEQPNSQTLPNGFSILFPTQTAAVINNQSKGDFIAVTGNAISAPMITAMETNAATYVPDLKVISLPLPGDGTIAPDLMRSDHAPFWLSGKKALMITDGANFRNANYHKSSDTVATLNFQFMAKVVKATLATAASWAELMHAGQASFPLVYESTDDHHIFPCQASLSPNPVITEGILTISNCPNSLIKISVFDPNGKRYFQKQILASQEATEIKLPTENLPKGVYLVLLETGESAHYLKMLK